MVQLAAPAERKASSVGLSAALAVFARFANLSIRIKASAASVVLLICLLAVGANAYLTSTRSAAGLHMLSQGGSSPSDEPLPTLATPSLPRI
jgi:hypothetical protein